MEGSPAAAMDGFTAAWRSRISPDPPLPLELAPLLATREFPGCRQGKQGPLARATVLDTSLCHTGATNVATLDVLGHVTGRGKQEAFPAASKGGFTAARNITSASLRHSLFFVTSARTFIARSLISWATVPSPRTWLPPNK